LVDESVPIKDFRLILEILSGANPEKKDAIDLTEIVRMGLRRMISYRYVGVDQKISCFGLDPEIEDEISQSIQKNGGDHYLAMSPDRMEKICQAIALNYQNHKVSFRDVVLLTSVEVRRYIRKIIENELPDVAVLSYQELDPRVKVDQRDTVSLYSANVMAI